MIKNQVPPIQGWGAGLLAYEYLHPDVPEAADCDGDAGVDNQHADEAACFGDDIQSGFYDLIVVHGVGK